MTAGQTALLALVLVVAANVVASVVMVLGGTQWQGLGVAAMCMASFLAGIRFGGRKR